VTSIKISNLLQIDNSVTQILSSVVEESQHGSTNELGAILDQRSEKRVKILISP